MAVVESEGFATTMPLRDGNRCGGLGGKLYPQPNFGYLPSPNLGLTKKKKP